MAVTVTPETFAMVSYDAAEIAGLVESLLPVVGLPADVDVRVEVDETVPTGRASVRSVDPVELWVESGALEDPKRPRELSRAGTADILGLLLCQVADRRDPDFGDPGAEDDLDLAHRNAWETACIGRLARAGYRAQEQRRRYAFRTRHGFSDAADRAFDLLWAGRAGTWGDIVRLSDAATAAELPETV